MSVIFLNDSVNGRRPRADRHEDLLGRLLLLIAAIFVYALIGG